ncbi:MAG: HPF/RaiA family ribosome-associated protein [Rhodothermaceae bacterium]|nr:HPF/RaiA family ribosome-associated protein [Bacteroidota bacterium]MXX97251.1 HPF/RaiA family ribosome-associated protein [Rhodothermaceae bacterium]MXZ58543.1 HPF/RaiA family ribosome-associated protein [Rhodothermaceae bacterium]MYB90062.1 HPF/RaiA family ribosome-associated protein [Rhodothermaceae bacterium]MYD67720.1 HPF/RaiA family ribosome-associated protein [Rhodothermaceae bacterium]
MTSNTVSGGTNSPKFAIEFYAEGAHLSQRDRDAIETRIHKLARGHRDIAGASVAIECVSGANKHAEYKARLVVYCKPANIAASRTQSSVRLAVSEALEAVGRQIREQRERMRDRHRTARAI